MWKTRGTERNRCTTACPFQKMFHFGQLYTLIHRKLTRIVLDLLRRTKNVHIINIQALEGDIFSNAEFLIVGHSENRGFRQQDGRWPQLPSARQITT